jgi:hypothetical protein
LFHVVQRLKTWSENANENGLKRLIFSLKNAGIVDFLLLKTVAA